MKLYYLPVPTDAEGATVTHDHEQQVEQAGGNVYLSRSFGQGNAVIVLVLPDSVLPAAVGLPDATLISTQPDHEPPDEEPGL